MAGKLLTALILLPIPEIGLYRVEGAMTVELKPCPFCGNDNPGFYRPDKGSGMWVMCRECDAEMFGLDEENLLDNIAQEIKVAEVWNRRAP